METKRIYFCKFISATLFFLPKRTSILHYAKATRNLRRGGSYSQARGTVGSGLTPGSRLGRRTPEIPDPEPEIRKKPENPFPARFAL